MKTKILRLTESDVSRLIKESAYKILNEMMEGQDNEILSQVVNAIHGTNDLTMKPNTEETLELFLNDTGDLIAYVIAYADDNRSIEYGDEGDGYSIPPAPDEILGDYKIHVINIEVYEDGSLLTELEDNGMVADALMDAVYVETDDLPSTYEKYDYEDF